MMKILVAESGDFSAQAASLLERAGDLLLRDLDRQELLSAVRDINVLWVRLRHKIDADVIAAAQQLNIIVTPTTGLNHIDLGEAQQRGIQVLSLQGEGEFLQDVRATAEHTVGLLFSLLRQIPEALAHVQQGQWDRDSFKGRELYGKTIGIVGYGRLGKIVARYVRAFDTRVLTADPYVDAGSLESFVTLVPLSELLEASDVVTLHVNLCDATRNFFGPNQFAAMKRGAWFVNTSRGEVVDEEALLSALESGRLAGAALDVLCDESSKGMPGHPLVAYARKQRNLIITPHLGGCTNESMEKTECFLANHLVAVLKNNSEKPML